MRALYVELRVDVSVGEGTLSTDRIRWQQRQQLVMMLIMMPIVCRYLVRFSYSQYILNLQTVMYRLNMESYAFESNENNAFALFTFS